jgi:hypothetical protein
MGHNIQSAGLVCLDSNWPGLHAAGESSLAAAGAVPEFPGRGWDIGSSKVADVTEVAGEAGTLLSDAAAFKAFLRALLRAILAALLLAADSRAASSSCKRTLTLLQKKMCSIDPLS